MDEKIPEFDNSIFKKLFPCHKHFHREIKRGQKKGIIYNFRSNEDRARRLKEDCKEKKGGAKQPVDSWENNFITSRQTNNNLSWLNGET